MAKVQAMMPIVSRKRRKVDEAGDMEEECSYLPHFNLSQTHVILTIPRIADWDMVFADDEREANPASFKFLEMAHKWKAMQAAGGGAPLLAGLAPAASATESAKPGGKDVPASAAADIEMDKGEEDSEMASSDGEE